MGELRASVLIATEDSQLRRVVRFCWNEARDQLSGVA